MPELWSGSDSWCQSRTSVAVSSQPAPVGSFFADAIVSGSDSRLSPGNYTWYCCPPENIKGSGKYWPSMMLKNSSTHLILHGWTIVLHYYQDVQRRLWDNLKFCSYSSDRPLMLQLNHIRRYYCTYLLSNNELPYRHFLKPVRSL